MSQSATPDALVDRFPVPIPSNELPDHFPDPFTEPPHPLCIQAADLLKKRLETFPWEHNFGLDPSKDHQAIGKMFGVLVVRDLRNKVGFLSAFSGKIGTSTHYPGFVPPVFDTLNEGGFLNAGMRKLTQLNERLEYLESGEPDNFELTIQHLHAERKAHSRVLTERLYDQYRLLNRNGTSKSLRDLFPENPPGGAGECAAPKLLNYAFNYDLMPLALAEFYWGKTNKNWKHQSFYAPCNQKCKPILNHMLQGLVVD